MRILIPRGAPAVLAGGVGLGAALCPTASWGSHACAGVRVDAPASLSPRWMEAARDARQAVTNSSGLDCAWVEVSVSPVRVDSVGGEEVRVSATTADGRQAERVVRRPSALAPTIVGLVASIPDDGTGGPPQGQGSSGDTETLRTARAASGTPPPTPVSVWAGLASGGRVSQPYLLEMVEFEGSADVRVQSWILCALFRFGFGAGGDDDDATTYSETDIGLGAGRGFALGATTVDAVFVPSLATMRFDDRDEPGGPGGSVSEFRLGARVRWSIPMSASWRFTLTADSEIAPQGFAHPIHTQPLMPALPAWTGGMRIGASGRLL
ncbi:MAG: hypothetical protein ABTD50_21935 [Polyangiaceae bacterium]